VSTLVFLSRVGSRTTCLIVGWIFFNFYNTLHGLTIVLYRPNYLDDLTPENLTMKLEYRAWRQLFGFYTNLFLSSTEPMTPPCQKSMELACVVHFPAVEMNLNQFAEVILQLNRITSSTVYLIHLETWVITHLSYLCDLFTKRDWRQFTVLSDTNLSMNWGGFTQTEIHLAQYYIVFVHFFQGDIYGNIARIILRLLHRT